MAFNHYAKIKRILDEQPAGWVIRKINEPTKAQTFKGEIREFPYYYRIYDVNGEKIKYCKFQQIELLAKALHLPAEALRIKE